MNNVAVVIGTRPEAIKMAPVVWAVEASSDLAPRVCVTGQHGDMLLPMLEVFGIKPHVNLSVMRRGQSLSELGQRILGSVTSWLQENNIELVLVQGDTSTTLMASLAAFYSKIAVGHVEAGLRTYDKHGPFPEEMHRRLVAPMADLHFAPTPLNRDNLIFENIAREKVFVTGNTAVDAVLWAKSRRKSPNAIVDRHVRRPFILVTAHRRENQGDNIRNIARAILQLARELTEFDLLFPVHPSPSIREPVTEILAASKSGDLVGVTENIILQEPLDYLEFVDAMSGASLILTDSGGVQEEAPSLGKPVLVMRDKTERVEAIEAGTVKLVGADTEKIVCGVRELMSDRQKYLAMTRAENPYGDGRAALRIVELCREFLNGQQKNPRCESLSSLT